MKFTQILALVFGAIISQAAFAAVPAYSARHEVEFVATGIDAPMATVIAMCPNIEKVTTELLEQLGATDISVSCRIGRGSPVQMDPIITMTFSSLQETGSGESVNASYREVRFVGDDYAGSSDCEYKLDFLKALEDEGVLELASGPRNCGYARQAFHARTLIRD